MKKEKLENFLKNYVEVLKKFKLPESDFPLSQRTLMSSGCCRIFTIDGRHVATISVKEDAVSPSMPVGPATFAYAKMFVELANAFMKEKK